MNVHLLTDLDHGPREGSYGSLTQQIDRSDTSEPLLELVGTLRSRSEPVVLKLRGSGRRNHNGYLAGRITNLFCQSGSLVRLQQLIGSPKYRRAPTAGSGPEHRTDQAG